METVPEISIYPIPFEDYLVIDNTAIGSVYQIRNTTGTILVEGTFDGNPIFTSQLTEGSYIIDIRIDNILIRKKIVK